MQVNKRQELYFATVVFILLTVHFFGTGLAYFDAANEIEENCSYSRGCETYEEEAIEEAERNGFIELFISLIMGGLAFFFWPQLTEEEKQKRQKIRKDLEEKIAEREKDRIELREKRKEAEKVRFEEAYTSGDLSKIEPRERVAYRRYAIWAQNQEHLVSIKGDSEE